MSWFDVIDVVVLGAEVVLKASLVLLAAALVAKKLRKNFPAGSHLTWVLAFAAIATLPVLTCFVPWKPLVFLNLKSTKLDSPKRHAAVAPIASTAVAPSQQTDITPEPVRETGANRNGQTLLQAVLSSTGLEVAFAIWLAGFAAVMLRSIHGLYTLRSIHRRRSEPVAIEWMAIEAGRLAARAKVSRRFDLRIAVTPEVPVPMTWGTLRPTVVLPQDAIDWSPQRFEATLLHELSHVRRRDFLSQLLAEFTCALYWYNPLSWMSARAMRSDAELAADRAVLGYGLKPSEYAEELLHLAADLGSRRIRFATLGTPAMTTNQIESRLESILAAHSGRRAMTNLQVLAALAVATVAIPAFAAFHASAGAQNRSKDERTEALVRLKQGALATIMYTLDADDYFPYVQQTASAEQVLQPYSKTHDWYQSPTKGGRVLFNMNLAGVNTKTVDAPATTPMWYEVFSDPKLEPAVAYVDGHVKIVTSAAEQQTFKKALAKHFKRDKHMRPLPADYLLPKTP